MKTDVLLIPITIFTWGTFLFLNKIAVPLVGVFEFNFALYVTGTIIFYAVLKLRGNHERLGSRRLLRYPIAAAAAEVGANSAFLLALERMPVSVAAPVMGTYVIVTVALAVAFLHERQSRTRIAGMALAVIGVGLLTVPTGGLGGMSIDGIGMILLVVTVMVRGIWNFVVRIGISAAGLNPFFKYWLAFSALFSAPMLLLSTSLAFNSVLVYPMVGSAIMVFGSLVYFTAMKRFPLGVVAPAISLGPGFTVLLAVIFLGETLSIIQGLGAGIAILGVMLLVR